MTSSPILKGTYPVMLACIRLIRNMSVLKEVNLKLKHILVKFSILFTEGKTIISCYKIIFVMNTKGKTICEP
jgi:hypothetical protein